VRLAQAALPVEPMAAAEAVLRHPQSLVTQRVMQDQTVETAGLMEILAEMRRHPPRTV